jgi:hypothetical protein
MTNIIVLIIFEKKDFQNFCPLTRLAKLKFRKSGGFYQKTGVYQENFFYKSGEKSGGFLFEVKGTLGGFLDYIHLIS